MIRRLLSAFAILCVILFAATLAIWWRSYYACEGLVSRTHSHEDHVSCWRGEVDLLHHSINSPAGNPFEWVHRPDTNDPFEIVPPDRVRVDRVANRKALGVRFRRVPQNTGGSLRLALGIPIAYFALAFTIPPGLLLVSFWRRQYPQSTGLCPECGYDLRATPERCPECGTARAGK